jgi:hypothetical protein
MSLETQQRNDQPWRGLPGSDTESDQAQTCNRLTPDWLSRHAPDIGWGKCDQVTTIPKDLLLGKAFGRLTAGKMKAIEDAVRLALGI